MPVDYWRQLDIVAPSDLEALHVTLIGCGGINSPTALALTKMGVPKITLYDPDTVEEHNLPNQLYRLSDEGKTKVEALADILSEYSVVDIQKHSEKFDMQTLQGVVISGVDSMTARQAVWSQVKYNPSVSLYIEGRMGAEVARIQTLNPCDLDKVRWYETLLYPDEKAQELPCTARAVIYNTFMIAALIANQVKKFVRGEKLSKEIICDMKNILLFTA